MRKKYNLLRLTDKEYIEMLKDDTMKPYADFPREPKDCSKSMKCTVSGSEEIKIKKTK